MTERVTRRAMFLTFLILSLLLLLMEVLVLFYFFVHSGSIDNFLLWLATDGPHFKSSSVSNGTWATVIFLLLSGSFVFFLLSFTKEVPQVPPSKKGDI